MAYTRIVALLGDGHLQRVRRRDDRTGAERVASAVGEGSICIQLVHRYLSNEG